MGSAADGESRAAGLVHTLIAALFLLVFFGAIGYTFWPELMPALFRSVQTVRTLNAEQMASQYFDVRNGSQASEAQVSGVVKTLEQDYAAITEFLGIETGARIPLLFTDGPGPALADGAALNVFYDNGVMNIDTAPFFLALLADGKGFAHLSCVYRTLHLYQVQLPQWLLFRGYSQVMQHYAFQIMLYH